MNAEPAITAAEDVRRLVIDDEFHDLISPLTAAERAGLESSILAEGCRDALVVWAGYDILLDGHNRYEICIAHGVPFETVELELEDRVDARIWVRLNQLSRRNLVAFVRGELVLGLEGDYAERARQRMRAGVRQDPTEIFPEGSEKGETRDHLAALAEMSGRTLDKIKHILADAPKSVLAELRAGALKSIDKAYANIGREDRQRKREEAKAEAARRSTIPATIALADWRDWLPSQPTCDLLLTDPPYSTDVDNIEKFAKAWLPLALGKVKDTGRAYVCIGAYPDELRAYLNIKPPKHLIFEQVLVWTYRNTIGPSPKQNYKLNWQAILYYRGIKSGDLDCPEMKEQFSVQYINAPDGRLGDRYHAWQKPDALAERFIRHALPKGGVMIDPFAGTGTFLAAAARLGREAHGCDIDPQMLQLAIERGCFNA